MQPWLVRGLGSTPAVVKGGVRSLLAFWMGGAGSAASAPPPVKGGVRSLLAFWMGGAGSAVSAPPPPPAVELFDTHDGIDHAGERQRKRKRERDGLRKAVELAYQRVVEPQRPEDASQDAAPLPQRELRRVAESILPDIHTDGIAASLQDILSLLEQFQNQRAAEWRRLAIKARQDEEEEALLIMLLAN